jgi:hypothetical protein
MRWAAAQIGGDQLPNGDARKVTVEVRNEQGQWVLTVTVTLEVHRVQPLPHARELVLPPHLPARNGT